MTAAVLVAASLLAAEDWKVTPGNVEEERSSDGRAGGLAVGLRVTGGSVAEVQAIRWRVKSARDDRGSNLYMASKDDKPREFEEFAPDRRQEPRLALSSPAREASSIDVAGEVELFVPARDPAARQRFAGFLGRLDRPLAGSALKSAKLEITPLTAAVYTERERQNRPSREDIFAEGRKHGVSETEIKQAVALVEALSAMGGEAPGENSVLVEAKDPDGRLISVDVVGADGQELRAPSRGSTGLREVKLFRIDLAEKPPADAVLVVTLRTSRSVVTVPFRFQGVALP